MAERTIQEQCADIRAVADKAGLTTAETAAVIELSMKDLAVERKRGERELRRAAVGTRDGEGGHAQRDGVADEGEGAL